MRKTAFTLGLVAALGLALAGCDQPAAAPTTNKMKQAERAAAAASQIDFTDNEEIDNIQKRLKLTSQPGLLGFVVLLNEAGQPILYTSVKGKISSSGKRLTKPWMFVTADCGEWSCDQLVDAPSDEGTYGSSEPYIYFWDANGVYHQWAGRYLYSDKPIRLRAEPLVISAIPAK